MRRRRTSTSTRLHRACFHGLSRTFTDFHGLSRTFRHFHGFSGTFTDFQRLKLKHDEALSSFALNGLNRRPCVMGVFGVYGIGVDPRHLSLIADFMMQQGDYRPCSRAGMETSTSPLLKMSFETARPQHSNTFHINLRYPFLSPFCHPLCHRFVTVLSPFCRRFVTGNTQPEMPVWSPFCPRKHPNHPTHPTKGAAVERRRVGEWWFGRAVGRRRSWWTRRSRWGGAA